MLHLKGEGTAAKLEIAKREIETLWAGGVDAVIVENYYGSVDEVVLVCDYLRSSAPEVVFGINVLNDDWRAFELANEYGARFLQLDSVAGHLEPAEDAEFAARLAEERAASDDLRARRSALQVPARTLRAVRSRKTCCSARRAPTPSW